jgi:hypothetical protein
MEKDHRPETINETASEYPGSLGLVADDCLFRLDAIPPDGQT